VSETFGDRLRRLREEQGFSIATLAVEIGVSEGAIRQMETGNVKSPSLLVGLRLAHRLGIDPYELALGDGSNLNERLILVERRLDALEEQVAALPTTRR
jgi:transcriptional regulator with XRE-family HTH domain